MVILALSSHIHCLDYCCSGAIQQSAKFAYLLPCHLKHPGFCPHLHSGVAMYVERLARALRDKRSTVGQWFTVRGWSVADREHEMLEDACEMYVYCAYTRGAAPKISVYAIAHWELVKRRDHHESRLNLCPGGKLSMVSTHGLAVKLLESGAEGFAYGAVAGGPEEESIGCIMSPELPLEMLELFSKSAKGLPRHWKKARTRIIDEKAKFFEDGFAALGKQPLATGAGERAEDGVDGGTNSEGSGGDCSPDTDADVASTAAVLDHIALEGADGSDSDGDAPNKLAAPVAGLAVAPTVDTRVFIWLARTSRSATCGGCTRRIEA